MRNIISFSLVLFCVCAITLAGCGKNNGADSPGQGSSADVEKFLDDYEKFIDEYCKSADKFSGSSMTEKAKLLQNVAVKGQEMQKYSNEAIAVQASMSDDAKERLEEIRKRADECSEKFQKM
ncbi:MAG: hypothetical protein JW807_01625 [Spirochaetes bacterium]|nr:hypothetical protein [Spirochaetota bacterium]